MTDVETLVCEIYNIRVAMEECTSRQNELLAALVATTQRIAVALEAEK